VIVFENGKSGFLGEHSCMDGTPTLRMNEFALASLAAKKVNLGPPRTPETGKGLPIPTELKFVVNETSASVSRMPRLPLTTWLANMICMYAHFCVLHLGSHVPY
jgi:hypothetical protein